MDRSIDVNADVGEGLDYEPLLEVVSSVSIACGVHAGDDDTMRAAMRAAKARHVRVGAHPSYPGATGFGRDAFAGSLHDVRQSLLEQLDHLLRVADHLRASVTHCKPHGRLYNDSATDPLLAGVIAESIADRHPEMRVYALAGGALVDACRDAGVDVYEEAFADRGYVPGGALIPRDEPGALVTDPNAAAQQALTMINGSAQRIDTICVHGDTPGALAIARTVRTALEAHGVTITAGI